VSADGWPAKVDDFRDRTGSPAVGAGLVTPTDATFHVTGRCRRDGGPTVTVDDRWHIGSCAKAITAALYARLVEAGRTTWDATVADLAGPAVGGRLHPAWADRTVTEVFHCRAGIAADLPATAMRRADRDTRPLVEQRADATALALRTPPHRPGRFVYSNLGYIVVGAAIDHLTGTSYEQALEELLLCPLGITTVGFGAPPRIRGHGPRLRAGHVGLGRGTAAEPGIGAVVDNPPVLSSAGTLHLTMGDWARFLRLFLIPAPAGGAALAEGTVDRLLAVPPGPGRSMAMGWAEARGLATAAWGMQGSNTLWSATALLDQHRHRAALVVVNDGRTRTLTRSAYLAAALLS
jgi:D-alanyl-D-alanine carboxypeptidase